MKTITRERVVRAVSEDLSIHWELSFPNKKEDPFFSLSQNRVSLFISSSASEEKEKLLIPYALGKALLAYKKENKSNFATRAEFLYQLSEKAFSCAWQRFLRLITRRDYAIFEIKKKLEQDGYLQKTIVAVIARAISKNLLDDERFAKTFIYQKKEQGYGIQRISFELKKRGIEARSLIGWPELYFEDQEDRLRAQNLLLKKRVPDKNPIEKLASYLYRRGFSSQIAWSLARERVESLEASEKSEDF